MAIGDGYDSYWSMAPDSLPSFGSGTCWGWNPATSDTDISAFGFPAASSPESNEVTMAGRGERVLSSLEQNYNKNFNVTTSKFEGTAADLDSYLADTPMKGMGKALLAAQEKYGVNALFLMAVMSTESGYGAAPARDSKGKKKYNAAGLKKSGGGYQDPKSFADCIDRLGSSLSRLYFPKKVTVESIRRSFCPGNKTWSTEVVKEMKKIASAIRERYM